MNKLWIELTLQVSFVIIFCSLDLFFCYFFCYSLAFFSNFMYFLVCNDVFFFNTVFDSLSLFLFLESLLSRCGLRNTLSVFFPWYSYFIPWLFWCQDQLLNNLSFALVYWLACNSRLVCIPLLFLFLCSHFICQCCRYFCHWQEGSSG